MVKKRVVCLCSVLILIGLLFASCKSEGFTTFNGDISKIGSVPFSDNLPTDLTDYSKWDRTSEWIKITQTDDMNAEIFANKDNDEALFLKIGDAFYELNWISARSSESDIKLYSNDIDNDGLKELIAIICANGGTHWYKEKLHIIDFDGNTLQDTVFPLEKYEEWVVDNARLTETGVEFLDKSVELNISSEAKLSNRISLVLVSGGSEKISLAAFVDDDKEKTIAAVITAFNYDNGKFTVDSFAVTDDDFDTFSFLEVK